MTKTLIERRKMDMLGQYIDSLGISKKQYKRVNSYLALIKLPASHIILHYIATKGRVRWGKIVDYKVNKDVIDFNPNLITWDISIRRLRLAISQETTIVK